MAVDLSTEVRLTPQSGATRVLGHTDARLDAAIALAAPAQGLAIEIQSGIPVGRGMGSSAALSVALVRALAAARGEPTLDPEQVFVRAMPIERVFHGNPSGVDVAVSAQGGVLRYLRGAVPIIDEVGRPPTAEIVVLDTGCAGDTAALVAAVGSRRPAIDRVLERIGALTELAIDALDQPRVLGALLTENHQLLCEIGVSTRGLDDLVTLALEAGAYGAKLSGAGGGGVVLALVERTEPLLEAARARGIHALRCAGVPR